jgi:hypothetical protein
MNYIEHSIVPETCRGQSFESHYITVVTNETTFDQDSMQFIQPVDMYNPGQINDKYLVFPKSNILV